jgi:hypothetical protein
MDTRWTYVPITAPPAHTVGNVVAPPTPDSCRNQHALPHILLSRWEARVVRTCCASNYRSVQTLMHCLVPQPHSYKQLFEAFQGRYCATYTNTVSKKLLDLATQPRFSCLGKCTIYIIVNSTTLCGITTQTNLPTSLCIHLLTTYVPYQQP